MSTAAVRSALGTPTNLQIAFDGEYNAAGRYIEFAHHADKEGFHKAASLFRTLAWAKHIHARNLGAAIKRMGAKPTLEIKAPAVSACLDNLEAAVVDEQFRHEVMYPVFADIAKNDGSRTALLVFHRAAAADAQYVRLLSEVRAHLDRSPASDSYIVCPTCGYADYKTLRGRCPGCGHPRDCFEAVA